MAKLMLIGEVAQVELTADPEDDQVIATCVKHRDEYLEAMGGQCVCDWTACYDDLNDATEYAADHADRGTR